MKTYIRSGCSICFYPLTRLRISCSFLFSPAAILERTTADNTDPEEKDGKLIGVDPHGHPQTGIWTSSLCLDIWKHVLFSNRSV